MVYTIIVPIFLRKRRKGKNLKTWRKHKNSKNVSSYFSVEFSSNHDFINFKGK